MIKQKFTENTKGRDFVVGDLHGQRHLLTMFLNFIGFDEHKDRMFSVGDLIDRGQNSLDSLRLINEPWFHCVKANHEQLMEDFATGGPTGAWWDYNGGIWQHSLTKEEKLELWEELLPKVQKLPWLITVDMVDGTKFHIIHAEFNAPLPGVITDEALADDEKFLEIARQWANDGHSMLWGRTIFRPLFAQVTNEEFRAKFRADIEKYGALDIFGDVSTIFSGHTVVTQPTRVGPCVNLDTGSFLLGRHAWAGITVTEPLTNRFWKIRDDVEQISCLEIM